MSSCRDGNTPPASQRRVCFPDAKDELVSSTCSLPKIRVPLADLYYTRTELADFKTSAYQEYPKPLQPVARWNQCQQRLKSPLPDLSNEEIAALASAIADTGASGNFWGQDAEGHITNVDPEAPSISVDTATGEGARSSASADHCIPNLPEDFPREGHVMPSFPHSLMGIAPICNAGYKVEFLDVDVVVRADCGRTILTGWRDKKPPRLWRFDL